MKRLLLSLIILLIGMPSICWGNGACTTAMPFLSMGMGVRASAMGKAFCAVADDGSAMYYNPAGLVQIKRGQMNLEYTRRFEDVAYTSISGVYPLRKTAIGAFTNILLTDETQITTNAQPSGTGKTFREMDGIFGVSGGINLTNRISAGATGKVCSQKIGDDGAMGFGGDMGFLYKTKCVGLGLVLQNLGTRMKFIDRGFALPTTIRAGLAWTAPWLTISGEMANILPEKRTVVCVGLEGWIANVIVLRGGYDSEKGHGMTAGFGARLKDIQLDYAFVPYEKFDATHRVSASVRFGSRPDSGKTQKATADSGAISRIMETTPLVSEPTKPTDIQGSTIPQQLDQIPASAPTISKQTAHTPASAPTTAATKQAVQTSAPTPSTITTTPSVSRKQGQALSPQHAASSTTTTSAPVPTHSPAVRQQPKQIKTVTIIVDNAPIFSGPSIKNSVITTVPAGVELILVDDSKKWYYQVKLPDGSLGWISYVNCSEVRRVTP
ncbi:MAG: PorV/PorQ family protein [bacterium]